GVLDRNVPELTLSVAHAYRELGLVRRSREVATALYESLRSDSNPQDQLQASQVAFFLTRLARNLEEEEQWLERSPQDSPAVQIELTRSRGQRALGERRLREADGLFAEVVRRLEEQGTADAAIVNNAALARVQRFECTGEVAHVDAAIAGLEHAVRLAPDNSLTLSNLAEILTFRARLRVLDRELHAASLRLDASAAKDLVDAISGDEGERLRAALRQDPAWRRAQEVTRQEQALAPRRTIGYGRAWSFIEGDDLEGLRALVARARAAAPLDTSDFVAERERYERGDSSERLLSDLAAERTDGESKLAEARRARHAPTLAAALFLLARSTIDHASYTTDLAGTRRAVQLLREARETWPALAARRTHAAALLQVALFEALPGAPALAQRWRQEQRRHSLHVFLLNAARADASAGERLRARPELAEAARLRLELEPAHLGIDDVILAELTGDRELAERAGGVRSGERTRLELELREALWPLPDYAVHRTLLSD
ncbi:MAG: hypothetical protein IT378_19965, partial [Sandaracinaceae bacterium]|nr:hypothetical protein [Sandaracinaceae bacterium]